MSDKLREELQEELTREIENWICKPLQDAYTITGICADRIIKLKQALTKSEAERERLREAVKISANYFGVFGVKVGEMGPTFGEAGRACAEALGYSGDSYSNSKWGEPTALADQPKEEPK